MAKIGLKYPVYAIATESGNTISYSGGAVLAKAVTANISIEVNDEKLYADDVVVESDRSFAKGTVTIGIDDLYDAAKVALLDYIEGATIDPTLGSKELYATGAASPAYVGFGFYGKAKRSGANRWRAIWLKKVQFGEPSDEFETKGANTAFKTPELEGTIMVAADERWKEEATFDTEAEAIAYLNGKAGISTDASNNLTALAFSTGTLTPTFAATTYNYSCAVTNNTAITAAFAAGAAKVYVDGVYSHALTSTVAGASIPMAAGNNKIIQIVVQESGKAAVTYTIMAQRTA